MGEQVLDRAFNKALSQQRRDEDRFRAERPPSKQELEEKEASRMRSDSSKMTNQDAIQRMILADKDKDYFRLLELPQPEVDVLGRPAWSCTSSDVSKAYRKLSSLVHPDKNPSLEARTAFEALSKAHRVLRDPAKLEEVMKQHLEAAKKRQAIHESTATLDERNALYAVRRDQAKHLAKEEFDDYHAKILQQAQERQRKAKRKREIEEMARRRHEETSSLIEEDDDDYITKKQQKDLKGSVNKRKGKPRIIF